MQKKNEPEDNTLILPFDDTESVIPQNQKQATQKTVTDQGEASQPRRQVPEKPIKTPSIKDALNKLSDYKTTTKSEEENQEQKTVNEPEPDEVVTDFSQSDLEAVWGRYINSIQKKFPRMYTALKIHPPKLKENYEIEFGFQNKAIIEDFKLKLKPSLVSYLRQELQNTRIELLEVQIEMDQTSNRKIYTDSDKLNHMMEKNPAMAKLKKDFNLDFD